VPGEYASRGKKNFKRKGKMWEKTVDWAASYAVPSIVCNVIAEGEEGDRAGGKEENTIDVAPS